MQILKELYTADKLVEDVKNSYQYVVELRDRIDMTLELAHKQLRSAQQRYKHHYDNRSRARKLKQGDSVLLPVNRNTLLMQWKESYKVVTSTL